MIIAPSVLTANLAALANACDEAIQNGLEWLHLDVMDGHFVPNLTIGPPVIRSLRKALGPDAYFDAHLMIQNVESMYKDYVDAGVDHITVHVEAVVDLPMCLQNIRDEGVNVGVSLKPSTPIDVIKDVLADVDLVLIMSVNPGFGGQSFMEESLGRIQTLQEMIASQIESGGRKVTIQIDGGINTNTISLAQKAGVDCAVVGSALYNQHPLSQNLAELYRVMGRLAE